MRLMYDEVDRTFSNLMELTQKKNICYFNAILARYVQFSTGTSNVKQLSTPLRISLIKCSNHGIINYSTPHISNVVIILLISILV